jgi:hypothetical protein
VLATVGLGFFLLAALELPPFAPPPGSLTLPEAYFGEWLSEEDPRQEIRILPDGRIDWQAEGTGRSFSLTGARARLSPGGRKLIAKLFFFKKEWIIDQPPHPGVGDFEMTLSGKVYRRTRQFHRADSPDRINI